jgi:tyrosine-protein phosphatase YwqE
VTPILAHVERYIEFREEPSLLEDLRERGALTQVTGSALLGRYGSDDQKAAKLFLKRGLVDILASDALCKACSVCRIDKGPRANERPSDHAPVLAEFRN